MASAPKKDVKPIPAIVPPKGSGLVTLLMVSVSTFAVVVVGMLFATGAAQKSALPRVRAAIARFQKPTTELAAADSAKAGAADSAGATAGEPAWSVGTDSLGLLRAQIDIAMEELEASAAERTVQDSALLADSVTSGEVATDSAALRDLARLVKVMEAMKPTDAARLLNDVDDDFTIDLVRRLKERQAAKVLTLLSPEKARAVAVALGRGAGVSP